VTADFAVRLLIETLLAAVKMSAPILLSTLVVGLLISIVQVVTQVQEMTLTFVPKIIVVVVVCVLMGAWMLGVAMDLARRMFETAAGL